MKIKTKLNFGVGLLFGLIILLAGVSTWYVNVLKRDTNNILAANYNTLEYSRNMLLSLEEVGRDSLAISKFEHNLQKQFSNVTEVGEKEATQEISEHVSMLKLYPNDHELKSEIRKDITELMRLNMEAIGRKSAIARETAESATIWIPVAGTLCFLIAFVLLVNLPGNIANPIRELTESIKQIAGQNYSQRVHFESHGEFGGLARSFNTMAQKLEEYANSKLDKVLKEKKRIETLINNMHDPVIGLDENKKILFANSEALKITGLEKDDIIGKQAVDIAVGNDLIRSLIQDLVSADKGTKKEKSIKIFADNKESYFDKEILNINIIPTGEEQQQLIGYVILLKNITPFKELDSAKTNFIATVSHELKTPISSIKMSAQLLEHANTGMLNDEQQQLIESIKDDSNRLLKITGELLNISQVETGNIQLNMHLSSPYDIMHYAIDATKMQAEQKRISIDIDAGENVPEVNADAEKTAWVLTNFITNAIRYSPENSRITLSLKKTANAISFTVRDEGKGIEPRYRQKIFDRYFQIPGSAKSGTGLGLAISKEFIEAQGGSIGVETEQGLGSAFFFELPC